MLSSCTVVLVSLPRCVSHVLPGLVATNLELGKVKEAAACAREAISCMPRSSLGYLAMGMVFSVSQPNSAEVS